MFSDAARFAARGFLVSACCAAQVWATPADDAESKSLFPSKLNVATEGALAGPYYWTRNYQTTLTLSPGDWEALMARSENGTLYRFSALARGFYVNDQRLHFTGMESSFGVEGVLAGVAAIEQNGWVFAVESEILLNQPYDANQLADDPERSSYLGNFDTDTLEISQLMLSARYGDLLVGIGKMVSPFGRTAFPIYSNDQRDAPFIRTESISWRETGVLLQVDPSIFVLTLAAVNGTEDKDTNSTKGLIGRTGIDLPWFSAGASFKVQDGIGSENQKMYQDHYGVDAALRWGRFCLSGEAIYDEYGAHEHGFDPDTITWDRGIYYREQNLSLKESIHGFGYYVNLGYDAERWTCSINYGEFFPEQIGDPLHDATTHRLLGKMAWRFVDAAEIYVAAIMEDDVENAQMGKDREGSYWLAGLQVGF